MLRRPLRRPASSADVCFSCQLRFLGIPSSLFSCTPKPANPRRNPPNRAQDPQRRTFSTSQCRRLKISRVPYVHQRAKRAPDKLADETISAVGRPGFIVAGESLSIDAKRLGSSSDIVVVREDTSWAPDYVPHPRAPRLRSPEQDVGILAAVKAEIGTIRPSDLFANIEEQRPKDPHVPLSEAEFRRIRKTMEEGFTNSQLERYIREHIKKEDGEPDRFRKTLEAHRKTKTGSQGYGLIHKSPWFPDRTPENERFIESPLRGYETIQHTAKQRLVLKVLRSCWQINVKEVVDSIGELELYINEPEFHLMTNSNVLPLEPIIARLRHDDGERIDAFVSRRVLRITANQRRAMKIAEEIEDSILKRINKVSINLSTLKAIPKTRRAIDSNVEDDAAQAFEANSFDILRREVAKMTGTSIYSTRNLLSIFGVGQSSTSSIASPAEIAKRLITTYYATFNNDPPLIGLRPSHPSATEALVRCDDLDSLPWHDRLRQWVRRTSATPKSTETNVGWTPAFADETSSSSENLTENTEDPVDTSQMLLKAIQRKPRNKFANRGNVIWQQTFYTASDVSLGQILHERPDAMPIEILQDRENLLISDRQAFSTTVPNLPILMENLSFSNRDQTPEIAESVVLRFDPSPLATNGIKISKAFPPVEMSFAIDDIDSWTRTLRLKDIKAVIETKISSVMLPDRPVDLQFRQRTTSRFPLILGEEPLNYLRNSAALRTPAMLRISRFLESSELNLITGIKTPSNLILPMDRHMCNDPKSWKSTTQEGLVDAMDIDYIFAGMEIRKKMQLDYKGWTLLYTDISAGKAGGRKREVQLRPKRTGSIAGSEEDFIRAAFDLADLVGGEVGSSKGVSTAELMSSVKWDTTRMSGDSPYFEKKVVPEHQTEEEKKAESEAMSWKPQLSSIPSSPEDKGLLFPAVSSFSFAPEGHGDEELSRQEPESEFDPEHQAREELETEQVVSEDQSVKELESENVLSEDHVESIPSTHDPEPESEEIVPEDQGKDSEAENVSPEQQSLEAENALSPEYVTEEDLESDEITPESHAFIPPTHHPEEEQLVPEQHHVEGLEPENALSPEYVTDEDLEGDEVIPESQAEKVSPEQQSLEAENALSPEYVTEEDLEADDDIPESQAEKVSPEQQSLEAVNALSPEYVTDEDLEADEPESGEEADLSADQVERELESVLRGDRGKEALKRELEAEEAILAELGEEEEEAVSKDDGKGLS